MKENFRAFDRLINISLKNTLLNLSRIINICLLSFLHIFSKILITAGLLCFQKRGYIIICVRWYLRSRVLKFGELLNPSFIKKIYERNLLKLKNVSILSVSIFFISFLLVNVNYHPSVNSIYNDDCPIHDTVCHKVDNNSNLLICDVYQIPLNDQIIFTSLTKNIFLNPYILTYKNSTRSPPA